LDSTELPLREPTHTSGEQRADTRAGWLCRAARAVLFVPVLCGCHDWPGEDVTALETQTILGEIGHIKTVADPNVPWPARYQSPPRKIKQVVGGVDEWKVVYFCRHHTAEQLEGIVHEQFAERLFTRRDTAMSRPRYTVTAHPATHQLVVRCPTEADVYAVLEVLEHIDIAPIQVTLQCTVSELNANMTMDRETTLAIENLFGERLRLGGETDDLGRVLPAFPGASLRDPVREKFGLEVGVNATEQGHRFQALVDILVSRGYLKVLMNPTLEVVNGQTGRIQFKQHVPLQQITTHAGGFGGETVLTTQTEYYDIIDSMEITPHVYADGGVGLETQIRIDAYLTPAGVTQTPIVTSHTINSKESRIRLGQSLVIGGLRKREKRDVIRGVPILKDLPILGLLFSGRDFEERAREIVFILTPTLTRDQESVEAAIDKVRQRHRSPVGPEP